MWSEATFCSESPIQKREVPFPTCLVFGFFVFLFFTSFTPSNPRFFPGIFRFALIPRGCRTIRGLTHFQSGLLLFEAVFPLVLYFGRMDNCICVSDVLQVHYFLFSLIFCELLLFNFPVFLNSQFIQLGKGSCLKESALLPIVGLHSFVTFCLYMLYKLTRFDTLPCLFHAPAALSSPGKAIPNLQRSRF